MLQRDCLLEWRNILSNTLFGLEIKGIKTKENIEYVKELLKKYKSINKLKEIDVKELEEILPTSVAINLKEFLDSMNDK